MSRRRNLLAGIFASLAAVLAVASVAWACVPGSNTLSLSSSEGPAGSTVTASGTGWQPLNKIEIRWDSASGTLLAEPISVDGTFSASITIPSGASPGVHYVHADHTAEHAGHSPKVAVFTVTDPHADPPDSDGGAEGPAPGTGTGGSSGSSPPPPPPPGPGGDPSSTSPTSGDRGAVRTRARRARAIAACKRRYSARRARGARGKKRISRKRAACIKAAKRRFSVSATGAFTSPLPPPFA